MAECSGTFICICSAPSRNLRFLQNTLRDLGIPKKRDIV